MAIRRLKKTFALAAATALAVVSVPAISYSTEADVDEEAQEAGAGEEAGTGEAGAAQEAGAAGEEGNAGNVDEEGEVVMEGAVGKVDRDEWITIKDYELIAENEYYKMYLFEPRLSIMLEDKATGKFIESTVSDKMDDGNSNPTWNAYMKSGIVLNALVGTNGKGTEQVDLIKSQNTIEVSKNDDGFSADISYPDFGFSLTVEVSLDGTDLVVNVPDDSIVEEKPDTYISTITLFPMMGYSFLDDKEGYMLIPDGNGALIYLDNKEGRYVTGFSQMAYGSDAGFDDSVEKEYLWDEIDMSRDANEVLAPIFGMAHTDEREAYIAVVEDGDERAYIEAHPNGVMINYNRCFARFLLRDRFVQPLNNSNSGTTSKIEEDREHSDLRVRYMLLSGDDANYSAMAAKYRDYLLENGLVEQKDSTFNTRIDFLGTDREEFLFSTRAVTMTTADDIEEIYSELKGNGVESVLSQYKGWQKGGIYNVPISKYKADRHIGGTSRLTDLIKESEGKDYHLYLYGDALRLNPDTNRMTFNTIKQINKRNFEEEVWAEVYDEFNYLTPNKSASELEDFVDSYLNKDVSNLALSGITNTLFSFSYKSKYYSRGYTADRYRDLIGKIDENANLMLEEPVQYMWKNTDAFIDMPLGSSDYMYVDEEVPFISMALKGIVPMYSDYVNFEANKQEFLLQMIEAGVYPSFYVTHENSSDLILTNSSDLYSTEYDVYKDTIVEYDKELRKISDAVGDAKIVSHEKLDGGVVRVTYDNGTKIYVNYSESPQTADGVDVDAMSYKVGEPNG